MTATTAKATVAISSDFLTAFAALPRKIQGRVTEFINKFRNNPQSPGINYEKIQTAIDDKIRSVRIDDTYRGIVVRHEESGVYILLWVDHHDEAYAWAENKRCDVNKETGNVQVYEVIQNTLGANESNRTSLFSMISNDNLRKIGVPDKQIPFIRSLESTQALYNAKLSIPSDAYEGLEWLANGFPIDEVLALYGTPEKPAVDGENLAEALKTDRSQSTFFVVEGEVELLRAMAEPLEKWRIFLHPAQRKLVERDYSGPCRILGGAGTGKTVVAMHRAKWLASQITGKEKILFTTFTANLAGDIKDNLRKICSVDELRRIEVIHLDAWVSQFMRENGFGYDLEYDKLYDMWADAIARSGESLDLPPSFYVDEWSKVVAAQEAFTKEQYLKASRIGRGTRLDRKSRLQVWNVFEEYIALMKERQVRDVDTAMYECRVILAKEPTNAYSYVIIDEGQDFSAIAYRLIRTIASDERRNDIFIIGDAHQRIYNKRAALSKCGVNIRGRSSNLRINYRTTEEIRKYAFAVLKDLPFDNLDDENDADPLCQSLTHGAYPKAENFKTADEEYQFIINEIKTIADNGVRLKDICLVARTHNLLNDYKRELTSAGIRVYEIKRSKLDDRIFDGIRVATMHRVKGLEFQYMFIAAVNNRVIPLSNAISDTDTVSRNETLTSEKCLLYVALTRAQKAAYITSYGAKSELIS